MTKLSITRLIKPFNKIQGVGIKRTQLYAYRNSNSLFNALDNLVLFFFD